VSASSISWISGFSRKVNASNSNATPPPAVARTRIGSVT
jgi:hypothetical protein